MEPRCAVCGEALKGEKASLELVHGGKQFSFCTIDCMRLFQQFPDVYLGEETPQLEAVEDSGF